MSHFTYQGVAGTPQSSPGNPLSMAIDDHRVRGVLDRWNNLSATCLQPFADGLLWPTTMFVGGGAVVVGDDAGDMAFFESPATYNSYDLGNGGKKRIAGITRDSTGTVLPNCIVKGYVTATDLEVSQCTSATDGAFDFCTQYTGAHYLVAYKAGTPDVAGTTVNTLVPV